MLSSCKNKETKEEILAVPTDSSTLYFPLFDSLKVKEYFEQAWTDTFLKRYYSQELFDLHEPVLHNYTGKSEIYRFTWLRSFHDPVSIRLQKRRDDIEIITKISDGIGFSHGRIIFYEDKDISRKQWLSFKSLINKLNYWELPEQAREIGATDGAGWVLEGYLNSKYHYVSRWSPDLNGHIEFMNICKFLMALSGISLDPDEIY